LDDGVSVTMSSWTKFHSRMMPTTAKACGQYLNSILAAREAVGDGYDEALLLDQSGNLCEGAGENIFLVKDGKLITNGDQHSILMGITRSSMITIARDLGLTVGPHRLNMKRGLAGRDVRFRIVECFFTRLRLVSIALLILVVVRVSEAQTTHATLGTLKVAFDTQQGQKGPQAANVRKE